MKFEVDFGLGERVSSADLQIVLIGMLAMLDSIEAREASDAATGAKAGARLDALVEKARKRIEPTPSTPSSP